MSPKDDLTDHLKKAPPIILSVLQAFKITKSFVAGIVDYHVPGQPPPRFTDEWVKFLDTYAILMWGSRDICTGANFRILKLIDVLKFATQDEPRFDVVKAKVQDYLNIPDTTAPKSAKLVDDLKGLDSSVNGWKPTVFEWIDKHVPKKDDGTSTWRMVMKDLADLKQHLPPEDRTDLKTAWFSDSMKPVTVSTHQIQGAWLEVWQEAQEIVYSINEAKDVPTLKAMKKILENGLSAYQILGDALRDYEGVLHASDLYWAYQDAQRRLDH